MRQKWEDRRVWYDSPAYQDGYNGGIYYSPEYSCWICAFDYSKDERYGKSVDEATRRKLLKKWEEKQ